jgi:transcriptional regulator with XRE-family HTH domain
LDIGKAINQFIDNKRITKKEFAAKLGISRMTLDNWIKGATSPDHTELSKMSKIFDVDISQLTMRAEGSYQNLSEQIKQIPFYDTVAVGGHSLLADQSPIDQPSEMINPGTFLKSATGALRVYGHSMYPKYPAGCIVAFKASSTPIPSVIIWGEDYVIELEERRIIKKVDRGDTKDTIKAVSLNGANGEKTKYQYDPIEIPISAIKRMYMVVGKIELEASI